jgi:hypothetical protein
MQIFKPTSYSTTKALLERLVPRRATSGLGYSALGTSLSLSNDMMLGMALAAAGFLMMKKKGLIKHKAA